MRLSRFTDYSLLVLTHLGRNIDSRVTISQISQTYGISKNHLMKVVSNLSRSQFVTARRGPGGGISLARSPREINLGDVIRHTEKHLDSTQNNHSTLTQINSSYVHLASYLQDAVQAYLDAMGEYTLADVLQGPEKDLQLPELREVTA